MAYRLPAAAMLALLAGASVQATSIGSLRPHDAALGCTRMVDLVADFRAGRPLGETPWSYREIFTDDLGKVEREEIDAFNTFMLTSEGRPDRVPMEIHSVHILGGGEFDRFYVLTLRRSQWRLKRYEEDGMLDLVEIDDPHWGAGYSTWLVRFSGSSMKSVRQVDDLVYLYSELERLEDCPSSTDKIRLGQD